MGNIASQQICRFAVQPHCYLCNQCLDEKWFDYSDPGSRPWIFVNGKFAHSKCVATEKLKNRYLKKQQELVAQLLSKYNQDFISVTDRKQALRTISEDSEVDFNCDQQGDRLPYSHQTIMKIIRSNYVQAKYHTGVISAYLTVSQEFESSQYFIDLFQQSQFVGCPESTSEGVSSSKSDNLVNISDFSSCDIITSLSGRQVEDICLVLNGIISITSKVQKDLDHVIDQVYSYNPSLQNSCIKLDNNNVDDKSQQRTQEDFSIDFCKQQQTIMAFKAIEAV